MTAAKVAFGGSGVGIWWEEIGRTTLGSAGDTITVSGLAAKKYLLVLINLTNSGSIQPTIRFNNDSGSNYSRNISGANGAAFSSSASNSSGVLAGGVGSDFYVEVALTNVAAREKIYYHTTVEQVGTGGGTAPNHRTGVGKWANTSDQVTRVDIINGSTGDFATGSEVIVLGHD